MTDKRFEFGYSVNLVLDNVENKSYGLYNVGYLINVLNNLYEENEQLKERNDRQSKRLGELYELMARKDWVSLTKIIDDFRSCEEQLQREWGDFIE